MSYELTVDHPAVRRAAVGWMSLGLAALIGSGLFALLLVLSRTPGAQDIIPWLDFFHTALVVHVDLSVLVWFVAFSGMLWTLTGRAGNVPWRRLALTICALATLMMVAAPFAGAGDPLMNNYIPVLQHPLFYAALGLFGVGMLAQVAITLWDAWPRRAGASAGEIALRTGAYTGALAAGVALLALVWSYATMPAGTQGRAYFETLFWGGGHVLQFTYTQVMLVAWLWLAGALGLRLFISPRLVALVFVLGVAPVIAAPVIYLMHGVGSTEHWLGFTRLMEYGGGIAALPIGLAVLVGLFKAPVGEPAREHAPLRAALLTSGLLFAAGGILGYLIQGVNTVIPAHYHGSIVGVTLAFMGLTYYLLPRFGFRAPVGRLAASQPYVYALGQFLHITGLAWSGFHGVQRKTAGAAQGLDSLERIVGMGLMGLGGLISIIGGILFLVVALKCMWPRKTS